MLSLEIRLQFGSSHQFIDSLSKWRMENPGSDILEHDREGKRRIRE